MRRTDIAVPNKIGEQQPLAQGMALVHHIFGDDPNSRPAHENVASAVFTTPQIATVGLTEEEAAEKYSNLNIYKSTFRRVRVYHVSAALPLIQLRRVPSMGRPPARPTLCRESRHVMLVCLCALPWSV